MTLRLHDPSAPRTVGSEFGGLHDCTAKGARCYGNDGDLCAYPACKNLLSKYNPLDTCGFHGVGGRKRKPRKRGEVASAGGSVVTSAAPPPRRVTQEVIDMAAAKRQEARDRPERVLTGLEGQPWRSAAWIAGNAGIPRGSVWGVLNRLLEEGKLEARGKASGGGYRLRQRAVQDPRPDEFSKDASPAARSLPVSEQYTQPGFGGPAAQAVDVEQVEALRDQVLGNPEPPAAGVCDDMCAGISDMAHGLQIGTTPGHAEQDMTVNWFTPKRDRAVITVEIAIDDLVEAVMERIAARMVQR